MPAGRVTVTAEERGSAAVAVTSLGDDERNRSAAESTEVSMDGDTLIIKSRQRPVWWSWRINHVNVDVRVPADSSARIKVASADVTCRGRFSRLVVNSASGDVSIDDVTGDANAIIASGDVNIGNVGGQLNAISASGDITAGKVDGDISIKTASGDIKIDAAGSDIKARSASGNLEVGAISRGNASARSISGRVSFGVTPGTGVWMDLNSLSGHIDSSLEAVEEQPERRDLTIQVYTVSGDVQISRAIEPAAV